MDDKSSINSLLGDISGVSSENSDTQSAQNTQTGEAKQTESADHYIAQINTLKTEKEKLANEVMRKMADIENMKRNHIREKSDIANFANQSLIKNLITPLEHLYLAFNNVDDVAESEFFKAIDMTKTELVNCLSSAGLERIYPEGEAFNPSEHQAISQVEDESKDSGTVLQVVQAGYKLNGRVIKNAMVVTVKPKDAS